MSLPRLTPQVAELGDGAPGGPPPPDPDPQPPSSKRPRVAEPGGVPAAAAAAAGWRLPLVPRLSEAERAWALPPRPVPALLLPPGPPAGRREETPAAGEQSGPRGRRESGFEGDARPQPAPSGSPGSGSRRFCGAGDGDRGGDGAPAEEGQPRPHTSPQDIQGPQSEDGGRWLGPGRGRGRRRGSGSGGPAGNPRPGLAFAREASPAPHEVEDRGRAGGATRPKEKERDIPAPLLKTPTPPSRPRRKMARPGFFPDCSIRLLPELSAHLQSEWSPGCAKGRARKEGDRNETSVSGPTHSYWPQNSKTSKRPKLLGDRNKVDAEDRLPGRCEREDQSVSDQSIKSDGRDPGGNVAMTLQDANLEESEACLDCCTSTRLEKCQSENDNIRHILRKDRESSWVLHKYHTQCGNRKGTGERWSWLQLSDTALLSQEDDYNLKAMNTLEEPPKLFMIGTLGSQKALIHFFWLSGKGEDNNMLQLPSPYYTSQKDFCLSNIFVNFIAERFYSHKGISAEEADNSILTWHEVLKCLKQTNVHNLIIRNINVNRRNNIYLQTGVSKPLQIILKANMASLLNNFDSLTGTENDSKLEEGCVFTWIMCLNYPKNMVENHIVYLGKTLTVSIPLGDNMKPMLENKKLFKTEKVFEEFKKQPINSFNMTTKNVVLMDFDVRDEISYKSKTCPEQVINVKHLAQYSTNTVKMHVNSFPQLIQNNYEYINENFYKINMHNENLDTERKQEHNKISRFNFKFIVEDIFNVRQQAIPASHYTKHIERINPIISTQVQNFGSLLKSEIEAKRNNLILKKEENVTAQSLPHCHQVHKNIKIEKEEKNRFYLLDGIFSVQPVSLMSREKNVEETKYVNQHNLADKKECEGILQESELANLKHFYPKNDSTECVKHQFEADLSVGNNECFQDLTAKCLPTEVMTIAKDFEMKSKFDLVLEELLMFHKISKEDEILSTMETNNRQENYFRENNAAEAETIKIKKDLKIGTVNKICASSLLCDANEGPKKHKRHQSLFNWETVQRNREQEVPNEHFCLRAAEEEVLYSTSEEDCEKPSPKRSSFYSDEFKEEKINYIVKGGSNFSHGISRVLPIKTCSRPIRVGLSRKAKLKQLHPYLK